MKNQIQSTIASSKMKRLYWLRSMPRLILLATLFVALFTPSVANAGPLDNLSPSERIAVDKCLTLIRRRYLSSGTAKGAFRMAEHPTEAWIEHYFVLEAMAALLASTDDPKSPDVAKVGTYLTFYATDALKHPLESVAHNFKGPKAAPGYDVSTPEQLKAGINKDYDSIDSYAGLFLLVSARYYKLTGVLPPRVASALPVSLNVLKRIITDKEKFCKDSQFNWTFPNNAETNGLLIARASYPIHQLLDAVEAHAGLREASELFTGFRQTANAQQATDLADGITRGIRLFDHLQDEGRYAYKLDNGNIAYFDSQLYPGTLANLFALSYLPSKGAQDSQLWKALKMQGPDDDASLPQAPSERWLIAAVRVAPSEVAARRETVASNADSFGPATYIDRMAITILALLDGAARYPTVQNPQTLTVKNAPTTNEGNAATPGKATFTVNLAAPNSKTVTVRYQTSDRSAKAGQDYVAASGLLSFAPGETQKSVVVNFIGETKVETDESFYLDLSAPTNGVIGTSRAVTILRNDDGPEISIGDATPVREGNSGMTAQTFRVTLSAPSPITSTVNWAVSFRTAQQTDLTAGKGTLTFEPGETSKLITVSINGDQTVEPDETYVVNLSAPLYAVVKDSQGLGTILNDDGTSIVRSSARVN